MHTPMCTIDSEWEAAVLHRELTSVLMSWRDEMGVLGGRFTRKGICVSS